MEAEPGLTAPDSMVTNSAMAADPVDTSPTEPILVAPILVALPGTMCAPEVFEPLAAELSGSVAVHPVSWLTEPGPWDIPDVADRVADGIEARWGRPVLVCGHSTGGAIALQLAVSHPETVAGLVLVDTGAHMKGHGDVSAILERIRTGWGEELCGAVLDRSFERPLDPVLRNRLLRWAVACNPRAVHDVLASQRDRLAEAGHTPVHETPGLVAAAVRDLLRR